jgi:hypothetical protein
VVGRYGNEGEGGGAFRHDVIWVTGSTEAGSTGFR